MNRPKEAILGAFIVLNKAITGFRMKYYLLVVTDSRLAFIYLRNYYEGLKDFLFKTGGGLLVDFFTNLGLIPGLLLGGSLTYMLEKIDESRKPKYKVSQFIESRELDNLVSLSEHSLNFYKSEIIEVKVKTSILWCDQNMRCPIIVKTRKKKYEFLIDKKDANKLKEAIRVMFYPPPPPM